MRSIPVAALLALSLCCDGADRPASGVPLLSGAELPLRHTEPGSTLNSTLLRESGLAKTSGVAVRDSASWETLWHRIAQRAPGTPLADLAPRVDFGDDMLLVFALGNSMPMGALYPDIVSATVDHDTIRVVVVVSRHSPECFPTNDGGDAPVALAVAPRTPGAAQFVTRDTVISCATPLPQPG